jgi:AmmeMemoRadiSam system protein A
MAFDVLGIIAPHPPIMVPEVGGADAEVTSASARALAVAASLLERFEPETVVIMSPHGAGFSDAFAVTAGERVSGDLGRFRASSVRHDVPGDPDLALAILGGAAREGISATPGDAELDHGVLVPMTFLDPRSAYPLVELSLSFLPYETHHRLGRIVARAAAEVGRRVAFVASGDCSHRLTPGAPAGYSPRAHLFDERLVELLGAGDFDGLSHIDPDLVHEAGECGLRSFITLGGFLEGTDASPRVLAYEGPWGVGYLSAVFAPSDVLEEALGAPQAASEPPGPAATPDVGRKGGAKGSRESAPVRLARDTIESFVRNGATPEAALLADESLPERAGAFVSLHCGGELRGCIGTISPVCDTLADEIARNAVEAAARDPRFPPVCAEELGDLDIKVDVLHEPEPISSVAELDPAVYGVIVTSGWRRGLLLPDLEGVDTAEQQVAIAMRKAGIAPGEPVGLERFKVDRHV